MKKSLSTLAAVAALLACPAAFSQYLGFGVGPSRIDINCAGATTCDKTDTGFKVYGGWNLPGPLALEAVYFDWGKAESTSVPVGGGTSELKTRVRGLGAGVAFFIPLAAVQCVARLGVATNRAETTTTLNGVGSSGNFNRTSPYYGTGCAWGFAPTWWLTGEADFSRAKYTAQDNADLRLFTLGIRHSF